MEDELDFYLEDDADEVNPELEALEDEIDFRLLDLGILQAIENILDELGIHDDEHRVLLRTQMIGIARASYLAASYDAITDSEDDRLIKLPSSALN